MALFAVALLGAAGCGDSAEGDDPGTPPSGEEDVAVEPVTLRATDFAFDPEAIEIEPGETVDLTFVNAGNVDHTFTVEELDIDHEAPSGAEVRTAVDAPQEDTTIEFVCRFHPQEMKGEIVVGSGGSGGGSGGEGASDSENIDY